MKRSNYIVTTALCLLSMVTSLKAQSVDEEVWSINSVKATHGPTTRDMNIFSNPISIDAVFRNDTLYLSNINTFALSDEKQKNDGFEHRREFRFKDKYEQTGQLILHEDPTAINSNERYLIFILYEGKSEGRVFVAEEPDRNISRSRQEISPTIRRTGEPNYALKGRSLVGSLVHPSHSSKSAGIVIVEIKVEGNVIEAIAGAKGTTITDKDLWKASEKAAKATRFTPIAAKDPQWGTITYIFRN